MELDLSKLILECSEVVRKSLVHDPERAALVKQAFEDLATGRYTKQDVIARATAAGLRSRKANAVPST